MADAFTSTVSWLMVAAPLRLTARICASTWGNTALMCFPAWEFFNGKHPFHRAVAGLSRGCLARGGHSVSGVTPTEDPQVFLATSRPGETPVSSGVGLALFDEQQRQIIPNETTVSRLTIDTRELAFHFSARYRAISEHLVPGRIQSDVWFTLIYP
jgi:hypothetical protein